MKRDALENIVRDAMTDVEVALNTDEIWRGVEQKLYPKKKKRFGWFLWGFALLALIALAVVLPMPQSQMPAIVDSGNTTKIKTSTMSLNSASVSHQEAEAQLADLNVTASSNDNIIQSTTQIKEQSVANNNATKQQLITSNSTKAITSKLNAIDKTKNNLKSTLTKKSQSRTVLLTTTNRGDDNESGNTILKSKTGNNISSAISAGEIDETNKRELINIPAIRRPIPVLKMINIKTVWAIVLPILNEVENLIEERLVKEKTNKIKISNTPTWAWHLGLLMGVDKPYRTLSGDDLKLLSLRNSTETVLEGWHTQVTTGIHHKSGFYTDFGLSISNVTEAVDVDTKRQYDKVGDVSTHDKDKSGQYSTSKTTGNNTYLETKKGTVYSRHTYYSVPLSLGYELPINKWSIAAEIGTEINLLKHSKGHQLNADNELISFNTIEGNSNVFLKRVGLNWNAKLKLAYKIKENKSLYLSPYLIMNDRSITQSEYALKQKYNRYGIALGYRINL